MEVESGGEKQNYECIGHPMGVYSDVFQKEQEIVRGSVSLCLITTYQEHLVQRETKEEGVTV